MTEQGSTDVLAYLSAAKKVVRSASHGLSPTEVLERRSPGASTLPRWTAACAGRHHGGAVATDAG